VFEGGGVHRIETLRFLIALLQHSIINKIPIPDYIIRLLHTNNFYMAIQW
jgi:hypothetical protein